MPANYNNINSEGVPMFKEQVFLKQEAITARIKTSQGLHPGRQSYMHFHETLEFLYITRGAILCRLDSAEMILNPGDILFLNSNVPHEIETIEDGTDCVLLQFQNITTTDGYLTYLAEFLNSAGVSAFVFRSNDPDYEEMKQHLTAIVQAGNRKGAGYEF